MVRTPSNSETGMWLSGGTGHWRGGAGSVYSSKSGALRRTADSGSRICERESG